jgi:SAM-dependent methyltransferase
MSGGEIDRRVAEREAADRRYNEALTAVDGALPHLPESSPRASATAPVRPALRQGASILGSEPPRPAGWRGRLAGFIWRLVAPIFERQQAFNAALTDEVDRMEAARSDSVRALEDATATWRRHLDAFFAFDSRLVQYLQQITPFVDTRMRVVDHSLSELRMAAAAAQRSAVAARRQLERLSGGGQADDPATRSMPGPRAAPHDAGARGASYVGFEDLFRGTSEEIRGRQRDDADRFVGASDVVDVGCGRGEFLDLLRERQVTARGVDANPEMADICRARGLDVRHDDALAYLTSLPDESLGGLMAAQVLEHVEPDYLVRLIEAAHAKLRPGALIVLETINAACWVAFFESYIRDITHVRPLHPDTLKFLVVAAGFEQVDIHFRSPIAEDGRLQSLVTTEVSGPLADVARIFNGNVERLNQRLFTYHDYAVIGAKGQ